MNFRWVKKHCLEWSMYLDYVQRICLFICFLTFAYVILSLTSVLRYLWLILRRSAYHKRLSWRAAEPHVVKQLFVKLSLVYRQCILTSFSDLMQVPRNSACIGIIIFCLFISFSHGILCKFFRNWITGFQIFKYVKKTSIVNRNYSVLPKVYYFALRYWQLRFLWLHLPGNLIFQYRS